MQQQYTTRISGPSERKAYSVAEAAALIGVHRATLHRHVMAGRLKPILGFGRAKISATELDRFLSETRDYQPSEYHRANAAKRKPN